MNNKPMKDWDDELIKMMERWDSDLINIDDLIEFVLDLLQKQKEEIVEMIKKMPVVIGNGGLTKDYIIKKIGKHGK